MEFWILMRITTHLTNSREAFSKYQAQKVQIISVINKYFQCQIAQLDLLYISSNGHGSLQLVPSTNVHLNTQSHLNPTRSGNGDTVEMVFSCTVWTMRWSFVCFSWNLHLFLLFKRFQKSRSFKSNGKT